MLARELLDEYNRLGLARIAHDEVHYLDEISNLIVPKVLSPPDILTKDFRGSWNGRTHNAIDYLAI
jgi:hypothetical protein